MKIGNGFISKIKLEYELKLQNCRNAFRLAQVEKCTLL